MVGLEFGGLKNRNLALLAKWGWRHESDSLRCRVVQSIHVKDQFSRHMAGKFGMSLHSPWMSISKAWLQVEAFAIFKLGNGKRISFWQDSWDDISTLYAYVPSVI